MRFPYYSLKDALAISQAIPGSEVSATAIRENTFASIKSQNPPSIVLRRNTEDRARYQSNHKLLYTFD